MGSCSFIFKKLPWIQIPKAAVLVSILDMLTRPQLHLQPEVTGQYTKVVNSRGSVMFIRITWPWRVLFLLPNTPHQGCYLPLSLSHTLGPALSRSMAASSPIQMPSLQIPSLSGCRHRIRAWEITLFCPYGASIALSQRTLNCNSAAVEKEES